MSRLLDMKIEESQTGVDDRLIDAEFKPLAKRGSHYPIFSKPRWQKELRAYRAGKAKRRFQKATATDPK